MRHNSPSRKRKFNISIEDLTSSNSVQIKQRILELQARSASVSESRILHQPSPNQPITGGCSDTVTSISALISTNVDPDIVPYLPKPEPEVDETEVDIKIEQLESDTEVEKIKKRFKCDQCDRDFDQKGHLNKHVNRQHTTVDKLACRICHEQFANKNGLRYHTRVTHQEKTVPCDECSTMFSTVGALNSHKKSVHVLRSLKCDQCKITFKTKNSLNSHKKSVHFKLHNGTWIGEKPLQCNQCQTRFVDPSTLRRHTNCCNP